MRRALGMWIGIAAILLGLVFLLNRPTGGPAVITLKVTGPIGVRVSATLISDGKTSKEEQALPADFVVLTDKLDFTITKVGESQGPITLEASADGKLLNRVTGNRSATGRVEFQGRKVKVSTVTGD